MRADQAKKKAQIALFQAVSLTVCKISIKDQRNCMCYIDIIVDAYSEEKIRYSPLGCNEYLLEINEYT